MATRKAVNTAPTVPPSSAPLEAYCVKCKTKRVIKEPHEAVTNGRRMLKGTCPECGTTMNRILGKA
jgi:hypothetical protein